LTFALTFLFSVGSFMMLVVSLSMGMNLNFSILNEIRKVVLEAVRPFDYLSSVVYISRLDPARVEDASVTSFSRPEVRYPLMSPRLSKLPD
jgi:hypothetical protein